MPHSSQNGHHTEIWQQILRGVGEREILCAAGWGAKRAAVGKQFGDSSEINK